jgi:hypothetical protein
LLALLAPIFPRCRAVGYGEMLLHWRFHVIVTVPFVFNWHAFRVQFPGCDDVIPAPAIVERVFRSHRAARVYL